MWEHVQRLHKANQYDKLGVGLIELDLSCQSIEPIMNLSNLMNYLVFVTRLPRAASAT